MTDIMLVDDEVLALEYLKNMVDWERNGYHVVGCATSGKKALELFDRTHPQIVISDIRMPGTDGLELTRQIKEKDRSFCPNKKAIPFTMAISWTESRRLMKCWFF